MLRRMLSTLPCARGSALLLPLRSTVHVRCLTTSSQWKSPEPKNRPRHTCVPWINTTKQQQMTVSKRGLIKRLAQKTQPTGKEARLKLNVPTLGSVIDPYQPVSNMLAPTQLWEALRNVLKNITSKFRIQKHDASFSMKEVKQAAKKLYEQYTEQLARGDSSELAKIVVMPFAMTIREEAENVRAKLMKSGARIEWEGNDASVRSLATRYGELENGAAFAQVMLKCNMKQRVLLKGRKDGRDLLSDEQKAWVTTEEFLVVEASLLKKPLVWRICYVGTEVPE